MAEVTGLRNCVLPYPIYGEPYGEVFQVVDADGVGIALSSPDSEISKNGDTAADCTNEAAAISGVTGGATLIFTGTEMTTDRAFINVKSTGAVDTPLVLKPRKLPKVRSGTAAGGSTSTLVLDSGASTQDDFYEGMVAAVTIDGTRENRLITSYVGSTKTATVVPDWTTAAPDSDDPFDIYLPEGVAVQTANTTLISGSPATILSAEQQGIIASGTIGATGNDTTHLHLAGLAYADDGLNNLLVLVRDVSAGLNYSTWITDFANTGDLATVNTLPFTPEASVDTYIVFAVRQDVTGGSGLDAAGVRAALGMASANLDTQLAAIDASFPANSSLMSINASGHVTLADSSLTTAKLGSFTLAKTTNITGFNDIAATSIVSGGAITTSGGAVSTVSTVTDGAKAAKMLAYFQVALRDDVDTDLASTLTEINADLGSGAGDYLCSDASQQEAGETVALIYTRVASTGVVVDSGSKTGYSLATGGITAASFAANSVNAAALATDAVTEIAGGVWDLATSGHTSSGTFGEAMSAAGASGDPWTTTLPGSYTSGQAGYIVGNNLNAAVNSRMATFTLPTNFADLAITATTGRVTVGTNADKTGYALATDGISAGSVSTAAAQKLAHVFFRRTMANVEAASDGDTLDKSSLYGMIQHQQESSISGTTWTVKKTDGSTTLGTFTITLDGSGNIVGIA